MTLNGRVNMVLLSEVLRRRGKRRLSQSDWEDLILKAILEFNEYSSESKRVQVRLDPSVEEFARRVAKRLFGSDKCGISGLLNLALLLEVKGYGKEVREGE